MAHSLPVRRRKKRVAIGIALWLAIASRAFGTSEETPVPRFIPQALDTAGFNDVEYSADGSLVVGASISGTVKVWRTSDHLLLATFKGYENLTQVTISPDSRLVAFAASNTVYVASLATGKIEFRESHDQPNQTWFLAFGNSNDVLVMGDADSGNNLAFPKQFTPLRSAKLRRMFPVTRRSTSSVNLAGVVPTSTFASAGRGLFAIGSQDGDIFKVDPDNLALSRIGKVRGPIRGLGVDAKGNWLVAAGGLLQSVDQAGRISSRGALSLPS